MNYFSLLVVSSKTWLLPCSFTRRASAHLTNPWTIRVAHIPGSGENLQLLLHAKLHTDPRLARAQTHAQAPARTHASSWANGIVRPTPPAASVDADGSTDSPDGWVRISRFLLLLLLRSAHMFHSFILLCHICIFFFFFLIKRFVLRQRADVRENGTCTQGCRWQRLLKEAQKAHSDQHQRQLRFLSG